MRPLLTFLALVVSIATDSRAQTARPPRHALMSRADSAWDAGDRKRARALYAEIFATDSTASRAVFRLAQLDDVEERALALYRRYIALEPNDPWGHMAEGDILARMGRLAEALIAYDGAHAILPGERDVAVGRARLLDRAGRSHQAADELAAWITSHPDDGEAWDLLGRVEMRAGRPRAAAAAFRHAERLNVHGSGTRLDAAGASAAPMVVPEAGSLGDSDGNRTTRYGGTVDVMVSDGVRIGAGVAQQKVSDEVQDVHGLGIHARLSATPSSLVRFSGSAGMVRYEDVGVTMSPGPSPGPGPGPGPGSGAGVPPTSAAGSWTTIEASMRLRVRSAAGSSLDLRIEQAPLGFNPQLIENRVQRSEARVTAEVPLASFRVRGHARVGRLDASRESANSRTTLEGALVLPLGSGWQPSVQYRRTRFARISAAGYFAPRLAETIETGAYVELGEDGALSFSMDVGGGVQRVMPHDAAMGPWSRVWRAWAQTALSIGPSRAWFVEVEAYDAPFALDGAGGSGTWRYLALSSGLRWAVR
jgi:hypothetical protein